MVNVGSVNIFLHLAALKGGKPLYRKASPFLKHGQQAVCCFLHRVSFRPRLVQTVYRLPE